MSRDRPHSSAAFAPQDVEDARRGEPAFSLAEYAAPRGLELRGSVRLGHLLAVAPARVEYSFNTCVGAVAPGRYGYVAHELQLVSFRQGENSPTMLMGGEFHGKRMRDPSPLLLMVPVVGALGLDELNTPAFPRGEAAVPTTVVALQVPEAAVLPQLAIGNAERMPGRFPLLVAEGLPGYRFRPAELDPALRAAICSDRVVAALNEIAGPYVRLELVHGQLSLTVNGFLYEDAAIDRVVVAAAAIADGLSGAQRPDLTAAKLRDGLPGAAAETPPPRRRGLKLGPMTISLGGGPRDVPPGTDRDGWGAGLARAAEEFGLSLEDADALHHAFPRIPVPGRVRGVLRGALPGGIDGRVTLHQHTPLSLDTRTAVLFAAPQGAATTPPGGLVHEATNLRVNVIDGVVACWTRELRHAEIGTRDTSERAARAAADLGLLGAAPGQT